MKSRRNKTLKVHPKTKRKFSNSIGEAVLNVEQSSSEERELFIRLTYLNLAIGSFCVIGLETVFFNSDIHQRIYSTVFSGGWFAILSFAILMLTLFLSSRFLAKAESLKTQYIGFGIYLFAEAILLAPILYKIQLEAGLGIIEDAAIITFGLFLGLTAIAFLSNKDFALLVPSVIIVSFLLLGLLIAGLTFGYWLRSFFTFALVALAGIWVLIKTSTVMTRYKPKQHVAAAISLSASLVYLFWTVLRAYSYANKLQTQDSGSKSRN